MILGGPKKMSCKNGSPIWKPFQTDFGFQSWMHVEGMKWNQFKGSPKFNQLFQHTWYHNTPRLEGSFSLHHLACPHEQCRCFHGWILANMFCASATGDPMQHRDWSGLVLSVHFHLPHAKTNTLTWNQAYSFIELFCGEAWVSKVMRAGGHCTASLDIRLGEALPGKQNAYDLLSDPGFAFLWLQVNGMVLNGAFQVSPPKGYIIYVGL